MDPTLCRTAMPLPDGEAETAAAAEDDVEAEGLQLGFLASGERRQGAT